MKNDITKSICSALSQCGMALSLFDLSERTGVGIELLQPELNALCAQGRAVVTKKGRYAEPSVLGLIAAHASALRSGAPIALPLDGGESMKILSGGRLRCLPDDVILVRHAGGGACELIGIPARGKTELPAFVRVEMREIRRPHGKKRGHADRRRNESAERHRVLTAVACDRRIPFPIVITGEDVPVQNDEIALLAIETYPEGDRPMFARVLRVLGDKSDMRARLRVIAEGHDFPTEFPSAALQQELALPDLLSDADLAGREDLRSLNAFTIDGPFSKDFDDAVSLERTEDGWRLGVHIADVSHYVRPGSPIDRTAFERGTSLYLPGLTVPMLPEKLSNNLCSLMPGVDRLALSLFMQVRGGQIVDHRLCRSVIHSHARLTYDAVNRFFGGDVEAVDASVRETLSDMLDLSRRLRARRFANGCIDLDLPETEFSLDEENNPTDVFSAPRGEAERLIEDFMLAANETVAMLARSTSTPLVYRIHEDPDAERLRELERCLAGQNILVHIGDKPHPGILQKIIEDTRELPGADPIRRTLLRSLQRAKYSDKPLGHYALSLRDYCHFTSPIRRYPDLLVHRMLKQLMDGTVDPSGRNMAEAAAQSSARELAATLAEREADAMMKARYMQDHIGRRYNGMVTGVTAWGMYVTLENTVEGLVHIATLDDYYDYDRERSQLVSIGSGNVFRLGDKVRVRVEYADPDRGEVDFSLVAARHR